MLERAVVSPGVSGLKFNFFAHMVRTCQRLNHLEFTQSEPSIDTLLEAYDANGPPSTRRLQSLVLQGCTDLPSVLKALENFPQLEKAEFRRVQFGNGPILAEWPQMSHLKALILQGQADRPHYINLVCLRRSL